MQFSLYSGFGYPLSLGANAVSRNDGAGSAKIYKLQGRFGFSQGELWQQQK
jgi:hypothetical protein